jgi:hypothetical protein
MLFYTPLGVGETIYNQYTITPLLNLPGVPTHKVHQLATKLHFHAIKSLNEITKTRHKIHLNSNSDNGGSDGGVTGRAAGFRRARRRPNCLADNRSSLVSVVSLLSFFGGALASVSTS